MGLSQVRCKGRARKVLPGLRYATAKRGMGMPEMRCVKHQQVLFRMRNAKAGSETEIPLQQLRMGAG